MEPEIWFGLLLSMLAGLSTTVGSILGLFFRKPGPRLITITLGFSGGVMLMVSFGNLLPAGIEATGTLPAYLAFFGGMIAMFLIDVLIPHEFMAERHTPSEKHDQDAATKGRLLRAGLFVALGLGIHNFPEGMATFAAAVSDRYLGFAVAIAIALHNIPEGLAVSAPVFAATGSRRKAFLWSFLSGAAEPVGALLTAAVLLPFLNEAFLGTVLAAVAGIMVFISIDELVPISRTYKEEHLSIIGIMLGMALMALSLWMLK